MNNPNFRELRTRKSCKNCNNKKHTMEQGWSKCTQLINKQFKWGKMNLTVCDLHTEIPVETLREKELKKLSPKTRKILGI